MFLDINTKNNNQVAIIDDSGNEVTYGQLTNDINTFAELGMPRCVVFCLCENSAGSLTGYLAFESNGQVPLLIDAKMDIELMNKLEEKYRPAYYWAPDRMKVRFGEAICSLYGHSLFKSKYEPYQLHEKLSLLLTTSGSTGSPKLIRHKYGNLEINAENVAEVFGWSENDRGICDLPMHYTMGLNVINSHLAAGATVLMIKANLMDPFFWDFIKEKRGTNFCGVPFSYEVLRRVGFDKMELPDLRVLAEGGGKLTDRMFRWISKYCNDTGRLFFATFGTSETSARIACLRPEYTLSKIGSIGTAIPDGELFLVDETVLENGDVEGELVYRGPNVTMGYADGIEDFLRGDDFNGEYHTGDIAKRDEDGFYYIVGRKKRFLKLFGLRVGLDETENIIKSEFNCDCACTGTDKQMLIYITNPEIKGRIVPFISRKTNIHLSAFREVIVDEIPRNSYGKVLFEQLKN